jgi:tRNA A-37 threonylcarbamoyl transferase component Bud32
MSEHPKNWTELKKIEMNRPNATVISLNEHDFTELRANAVVVEADPRGEKVLCLSDGTYLKLFRRKRLLSTGLFFPASERFSKNASALEALEIPCPKIVALYNYPVARKTAVRYVPLKGITIRQALSDLPVESRARLIKQIAAFIGRLHNQGVYFRSLHFGNIILTPDEQLGLIDLSDMSIKRKRLTKSLRLRNFKHLSRYKKDMEHILDCGFKEFLINYNSISDVLLSETDFV